MSETNPPEGSLLPAKRPRGRPRKDGLPAGSGPRVPARPRKGPAPPQGRRAKLPGYRLLPILAIDFTKSPAEQVLPCSEIEQARHLGWYRHEVEASNQELGIYRTLPMICQASGCHWASQCPTAPDFMFKNRPCPLEMMDAYRMFVGFVRELDVMPDDHTDLDLIRDLVRIDLQLQRIDQQLQVHGMLVDTIGGIAQSTGKAFLEKGQHPLLMYQSRLRNDRNKINKDLLASRAEKKKVEQVEGKQKLDNMTLMMKLRESAEARLQGAAAAVPLKQNPFDYIDGELSDAASPGDEDAVFDEDEDEE